ncbi:PREDICTED: uncharacterized protein LOC105569973 isoform X1 [Vollenhovia emeryi]|uniref:uncharacterized protein LOC105569973 isoform X1 n=1 Tax=Vollenhovia emeryi TaxID=411798 RepID=UPI0005F40307|nr:PREDICTED: uncharacterized protein LOC105569973 isoform X1 [Vollenhovia emeryi]
MYRSVKGTSSSLGSSSVASLASISAISFPASPLCAGIHTSNLTQKFSASLTALCFNIGIRASAIITLVGVLFLYPIAVLIPCERAVFISGPLVSEQIYLMTSFAFSILPRITTTCRSMLALLSKLTPRNLASGPVVYTAISSANCNIPTPSASHSAMNLVILLGHPLLSSFSTRISGITLSYAEATSRKAAIVYPPLYIVLLTSANSFTKLL